MTPVQSTLLIYVLIALPIATLCGIGAARIRSWWLKVPLAFIGFMVGWSSIVLGVGHGFDTWQAMADPPDEAFADGAQLMASFFAGWIPAAALMTLVILLAAFLPHGRKKPPQVDDEPRATPPRFPADG